MEAQGREKKGSAAAFPVHSEDGSGSPRCPLTFVRKTRGLPSVSPAQNRRRRPARRPPRPGIITRLLQSDDLLDLSTFVYLKEYSAPTLGGSERSQMEPGAQFPPALDPGAQFTSKPYTILKGLAHASMPRL